MKTEEPAALVKGPIAWKRSLAVPEKMLKGLIKTHNPRIRYGIAVLACLSAFLLTDLSYPLIHGPVFLLPHFAVMISALYGGGGPGMLATFLSALAFAYYFLPWSLNPADHTISGMARLSLFVLFSSLISWVSASFRSAYRDAETARAEAEAARQSLAEREAHFRRVVESNMIGIMFWDSQGAVTEANAVFLQMVGYTREDLAMKRVCWKEMTPPEYHPLHERAFEEMAARGVCTPFEKEYVRKDGSRVPILIGCALLEGFQDRGVCFVVDMTERKRMEEALKQKTAEAEEANRFKSQLVSTISHDLRTPLNAILGYTHLLLNKTYGPIAEVQASPLERIGKNANGLLRLINEALDLSKIESGKMSVDLGPVEIPSLIEEILTDLKPLWDQKGLAMRRDMAKALPTIESDAMKIKQILTNLLSNAIKFTDQGEIRIVAENRSKQGGIEVVIEDTGIGLRPEALSKIFEVFYQVDGVKKTGGSGLGLAIVRDFVHLLKGEITVRSEYGKGSTFTVFLPRRFSP